MFIHILSGLIFIYLFARLVWPLKLSGRLTSLAGLFLLLVSVQHFINRTVFGSMSSPEIPRVLVLTQGWLFITLIFLLLLCLGRDMFLLARFFARRLRSRTEAPHSPERRQALLLLAGAAIPAAYGAQEAVALPDVKNMEARLTRLPRELDGLRIAHLTDLHASPLLRGDWVAQVVERVNALDPDLILFTGDIVDGLPDKRDVDVAPLKNLKARYGIYSCAGNHEYYSDHAAWMRTFPTLGIRMLMNQHVVLTIAGQPLVIAGITDIAAQRFILPTPDPAQALQDAPEDALRIMLSHRPNEVRENSRHGVDLQLSGHTHGGHMYGMTKLVSRFNDGYIYGWYEEGNTLMYLSSGAGLWCGFPVRIGAPSEIAHITLRCA
jgi:Predicted phosphohydrolases